MTVDELRELLEQLGLGELGTDTPWDGRRIDGLVSLGLAEYRGNGWYSITDAGRELLEALRDRERLELAMNIAVGYHADGMIALGKNSNPQVHFDRDGLMRIGIDRALREADEQLVAKLGAVPGGQEPGGEKLPEVAGSIATTPTMDSASTVEPVTGDEHMCPECFSCDSSLVKHLSGKTAGHCRSCGHKWQSQEVNDDSTSE